MNQLVNVRINHVFTPENDEETKFTKFHELIFLSVAPDYRLSNTGEVLRERKLEEHRFFVSDFQFDKMIETIQELRGAKPSELK